MADTHKTRRIVVVTVTVLAVAATLMLALVWLALWPYRVAVRHARAAAVIDNLDRAERRRQ